MMRVGCLQGGYDVLALRKNPPKGLKVYEGPSVDATREAVAAVAEDLKKPSPKILGPPAVESFALTPGAIAAAS
jgi:hypothetical protein